MTPRYLKKYESQEEEIKQKKQKDDKSNAFNVLMRQAANDMDESIKVEAVMEIILKNKKTILYSEFLSKGLALVEDALEKRKIPFFRISGETTMTQRKKIVQKMNTEEEGGCNLILITKAGGEGLDFKGIRKVIILEKGWNVSVEEQVIGRAIRYKSHIHLPPNKQNVKVYTILAVKPYYVQFEECLKNLLNEDSMTLSHVSILKNEEYINQEKYVMPPRGKMENIGVDVNMYVQALVKEKENIELRKKLEKEQITLVDIFSEDFQYVPKTIFDHNSSKKLPLSRFILLPLPEKGFHKKSKKIEIFDTFHTLCKKYGNTIDMLCGGFAGEEYMLSRDLLEFLPRETKEDKYLIDILRTDHSVPFVLFQRNEIERMEHFFSKFLSASYTKYKLYFLMFPPLQIFLVCDRKQPKTIFCSSFFLSVDYFIENLHTHSFVKIEEDLFFSFIAEIEAYARKFLKADTVVFSHHKKDKWGIDSILESAGYSKDPPTLECEFFEKEEISFFHL